MNITYSRQIRLCFMLLLLGFARLQAGTIMIVNKCTDGQKFKIAHVDAKGKDIACYKDDEPAKQQEGQEEQKEVQEEGDKEKAPSKILGPSLGYNACAVFENVKFEDKEDLVVAENNWGRLHRKKHYESFGLSDGCYKGENYIVFILESKAGKMYGGKVEHKPVALDLSLKKNIMYIHKEMFAEVEKTSLLWRNYAGELKESREHLSRLQAFKKVLDTLGEEILEFYLDLDACVNLLIKEFGEIVDKQEAEINKVLLEKTKKEVALLREQDKKNKELTKRRKEAICSTTNKLRTVKQELNIEKQALIDAEKECQKKEALIKKLQKDGEKNKSAISEVQTSLNRLRKQEKVNKQRERTLKAALTDLTSKLEDLSRIEQEKSLENKQNKEVIRGLESKLSLFEKESQEDKKVIEELMCELNSIKQKELVDGPGKKRDKIIVKENAVLTLLRVYMEGRKNPPEDLILERFSEGALKHAAHQAQQQQQDAKKEKDKIFLGEMARLCNWYAGKKSSKTVNAQVK